jgi:hypothetical protein
MKKIILIVMCICLPLLWSGAHAEESKKFSYCGENIKFYIPSSIDRKSLEKQSEPYTCKHGFTLKSNVLKKTTDIEFTGSYPDENNVADEEYLAQFKADYPQRLHYVISYKTPNGNGTTTIVTFYWLNSKGTVKKIEKILFFSKDESMTAIASYTANPNDPNDILFMNALEQLFLSAEIDW